MQLMTWTLAIVFVLGSVALGLWTAPRWLVPWIAARSPRCLYAVSTREKLGALTLDDGPDPLHTPAILRLLREHDARATFFFISENVPGAEHVLAEAVAQGHELGNHLTRDEPSIRLSPSAFIAAIREAGAVLSGFGPVLWLRPGSAW